MNSVKAFESALGDSDEFWMAPLSGGYNKLCVQSNYVSIFFLLSPLTHLLTPRTPPPHLFFSSKLPVFWNSSALSSLLQRPDANPGVQPGDKNCVEFSQAPADGKDPVHPSLPCRPQDIKECKRHHLQPDPSPLSRPVSQLLSPHILHFFLRLSVSVYICPNSLPS